MMQSNFFQPKMMHVCRLIMLLTVAMELVTSAAPYTDELYMEPVTYHSRLVKDLMKPGEYDPRVRPVRNSFAPVNVSIRINLYQVIEVNEYSQFVRIYVWMTQNWVDEFLSWNPNNYNGLDTVVLPYQDLWLPDTYLYNSLQMKQDEVERITSVIVTTNNATAGQSGSTVTFRYPAIYSFTCNMDIYYFPFDKQNCMLTFGSWTYDSTGIDFFPVKEDVFREDFIESEEWNVLSAKMERRLEQYSCCPNSFSLLLIRLVLKRKPLFYIVNLVLPALVITFVAFVGFFCPDNSTGERKEKVNLGIGTLLAMSVLLLTTSNQMPTTSKYLPLLGWFYLYIILFISLATITTCVIIKVETNGRFGTKMSPTVRRIFFQHIGNLLFMPEPSILKTRPFYLLRTESYAGSESSQRHRPSSRLSFLRAASPTFQQRKGANMQQPSSWTQSEAASITSEDNNPTPAVTTPAAYSAPGATPQQQTANFLSVPGGGGGGTNDPHQQNGNQLNRTWSTDSKRSARTSVARLGNKVNNLIENIAVNEQKREMVIMEWQWLAILLDRILLIFFLTSLIMMTSYFFLAGYVGGQN